VIGTSKKWKDWIYEQQDDLLDDPRCGDGDRR
jgi:hypothetical protein